jgi:hypothetical protein
MAWSVKWSVHKICKCLSADVLLQTQFPSQSGRLGLGHGVFSGDPSKSDIRKLITKSADDTNQQKLLSHSVQLSSQGEWFNWSKETIPFDLSWKNLIFGPGGKIISFVLNATINGCKTPAMMKLWGYKNSDLCSLCEEPKCTLHHILSNCDISLKQQRYTWRHDSVLLHLKHNLSKYLAIHAKRPMRSPKQINFVRKGFLSRSSVKSSVSRMTYELDKARDWKLLVDFTKKKSFFPPEVYGTSERPDIVLVSHASHQAILVELTCPAEEGIEAASLLKKGRYTQLLANVNDDPNNPWSASLFTIEGGARGFVAHSMLTFLRKIGMAPRKAKSLCKEISSILARCSYTIFLHKDTQHWDANRNLLELSSSSSSSSSPLNSTDLSDIENELAEFDAKFEAKLLDRYSYLGHNRPSNYVDLQIRLLDDLHLMICNPDLFELSIMLDM